MKAILLILFASVLSFGQFAQEVVTSESSADTPITSLFFRDGSNNTQYVCKALSTQPIYGWYWSPPSGSGTITSISVTSNVATITFSANHGLQSSNRLILGAATTASLAGSYVVTVTGATTLTIPTSGVANGNITSGTDPNLVISTNAPRSNATGWSIFILTYTTTYVNSKQWAEGTTAYTKICDNRATYAYN